MAVLPTPQPLPQPTDPVLVGFADHLFDRVHGVSKSALQALVPTESVYGDADGNAQTGYLVQATTGLFGVIVAAFTTREERQDYIRNNTAAWLP